MVQLTKNITLYNGSDLTPSHDYTDTTDWPGTQLSTAGFNGQGAAGQWQIRDEAGVIPDGAGTAFLSGHNVVIATVGSNTIWRGRVAASEQFRGRQKAGRAHEFTVTLEDQNSHLRGIVAHNWERPAETDAARAQALVAAYLSGSPRATTNLNGSNLIITSSNAISLPAKTYSGVTPYEIMQELADTADKEFFVSVDNELAYFGHDYTGYASLLRISDDPADANATTYAPWDPRGNVVSRDELSALRSYYGTDTTQSTVRVTNTSATYQDYWEEVFWDSESVTAAQAASRAQAMLNFRVLAAQNYTCAIGPMTGDEVWKIKPGQRIQFKARAARAGRNPDGTFAGDTFGNARVREIAWDFPAEDQYIAHLQLERPNRTRVPRGNQALATQPKPNPTTPNSSTPEGATLYKFFDANDGGDYLDWTGILANQAGGAEGSAYYYFKSSAPSNYCLSFAATAGTVYRINGYTHLSAGNGVKVAWRNDAAGSTGAITDTNPVVIRVDQLATGTTSKWTPFEQELTAPSGTTSMSLGRSGSSADFDRIRIYTITAAQVGTGGDNTTAATDYGQIPSPGSDVNHYALADHTHGTPPLPPRTIIDVLTNNSGVDIAWGDVVRVDTAADDGFTTNTTTNFSSGWLGVAQSPIGSNAAGPILLQGYAPVVNVGSNSTTRGHFLFGSNMARRAYGAATRTTGAFGQVLTTSVAPDAIIWATTDGSAGGVATDTIWDAAGDLAVGTGADAAARLAIGGSNTHLVSDGVTASWQSNTFGAVDAASALASGTGDVTITGSLQDLTGASLSLEAGTYIVTGVFDVVVNNALNDRTFEGHLDSGGADQNDIAILIAGTLANDRWTIPQTWRIVLTSTTTVKLRGKYSGGTTGDFTSKGANTTIAAYRAGGKGFHGAKAYHSTTQSINNTTDTKASLNSEEFDTDAFHDTSTNNSRFTIPTGLGGYYHVGAGIEWDTNATNGRFARFMVNGASIRGSHVSQPGSAQGVKMVTDVIINLTAGDYIELNVWQNSGGTRTIGNATDSFSQTTMWLYKID